MKAKHFLSITICFLVLLVTFSCKKTNDPHNPIIDDPNAEIPYSEEPLPVVINKHTSPV